MEEESKASSTFPPNPKLKANILSQLTFSWTKEVFEKCSKRELEIKDLYAPLEEHQSNKLGNKLERLWEKEILQAKKRGVNPSLLKAILAGFGAKMALLSVMTFIGDVLLRIAQPPLLAKMLEFYIPGSRMSKAEAWLCAGGLVFCSIGSIVVINPVYFGIINHALKLRVAICSIIYRKTLRLKITSLNETGVGKVVNLMSNDVGRIEQSCIFIQYLLIGPVTLALVTYLLYIEVGVAAFFGVGSLIASIPFLAIWLGRSKSKYRMKTAKLTDGRVALMNEILEGISVIKMFTWERIFQRLISEARRNELKSIRSSTLIMYVMMSFTMFNNRVAILSTVVAYVLSGNTINAPVVYLVFAYFRTLRRMMSDIMPFSFGFFNEFLVVIRRIESFLTHEERETLTHKANSNSNYDTNRDEYNETGDRKEHLEGSFKNHVVLKDMSAKWCEDIPESFLDKINIDFESSKLSLIIGPVGSGKSSLLQVILRELPMSGGTLDVFGTVSYAPQEPWLFEGSVRQNILFGSPYNDSRYRAVLRTCALRADMRQWPSGDRTWVGERGVILSGGQRARISLARAIYRDTDIYVLDDPLSAVDSHVGKHLFEEVILGFLRGKTVILATHQLQFLESADSVVLLLNGTIEFQGSYEALEKSNIGFLKLMMEDKVREDKINETVQTSYKRNMSRTESVDNEGAEENVEEIRSKGVTAGKLLIKYMSGGNHWLVVMFLLIIFSLSQFVGMSSDLWLNYWVNLEDYVFQRDSDSPPETLVEYPFPISREWCMIVFTVLVLATVVISLVRAFVLVYVSIRSSQWLHDSMYSAVVRATASFFHLNPSGRILNRFTKDVGVIDELLPSTLQDVLQVVLIIISVMVVVVVFNPMMFGPTSIFIASVYFFRKAYIRVSQATQRLEGITKSPMFSHVSASLKGLSSIRVFNAESILETEFDGHQDLNSSAYYIFMAANRAFGFWLEIACFVYVSVVIFSFLVIDDKWVGGNVGLVITQIIGVVGMFPWGLKQTTALEAYLSSVERILEYKELEQEPPLQTDSDKSLPPGWPSEGQIEFNRVVMSYDLLLPPVLKELSFVIHPREKVGVVGRTGAGKSSLTAALFRLTPIDGKIFIDNIDAADIGLHDLRSKLSIIPQVPVLFSGSVRINLDPYDEHADHVLWSALEEVELKDVIEDWPEGLNSKITEGGSNLSVGQRQLMCLARAIVRSNKILILDEATANVDPQTDALIQTTIRRKFSDCTVLTVAHRLETVMDSDRILVMSNGRLMEFDHPYLLLKNKNSYFYNMVEQLGKATSQSMHNIAYLKYYQHASQGEEKEV